MRRMASSLVTLILAETPNRPPHGIALCLFPCMFGEIRYGRAEAITRGCSVRKLQSALMHMTSWQSLPHKGSVTAAFTITRQHLSSSAPTVCINTHFSQLPYKDAVYYPSCTHGLVYHCHGCTTTSTHVECKLPQLGWGGGKLHLGSTFKGSRYMI